MAMDSKALCSFCETIDFRPGFYRVLSDPVTYDTGSEDNGSDFDHDIGFEETLTLDKILRNSEQCIFCGKIAERFRQWSLHQSGDQTLGLENACSVLVMQIHSRSLEVDDEGEPEGTLIRIYVDLSFYRPSPERGVFGPRFEFQKCSPRPPTVTEVCNASSLFDWEDGEKEAYSGRIRPLVADTRLFRKWKESCCDIHGDQCNMNLTGIHLPRLRLIDVEKRCVVDSDEDHSNVRFTALSYVWGKVTLPQLTKSTDKLFREPGSLNTKMLPSIIDDAIEVTKSLGEKYIWIDCLCIMQDNEADVGKFISRMNWIFGSAIVTIVAASGGNAEARLPGIKPNSRTREQIPFTIKGVSLLETLDPEGIGDSDSFLGESVWQKRAWTFQEKLFSGRALIFTSEQVYWECQKASWCEDGLWETTKSPTIYRHSLADADFRQPWEIDDDSFERIYRKLVEEYSSRMLSFGSDYLRAFAGVLNHFIALQAEQWFFWGLPGFFLSTALTWPCDPSATRRLDCCSSSSGGIITLHSFPSWSWVGWVGEVYYVQIFGKLTSETVDLIFYFLDENGLVEEIHSALPTQSLSEINLRTDGDKTIVNQEDIPDCVLARSISSNTIWFSSSGTIYSFRLEFLCFWSSAAILHVRRGKHSDGEDMPYLRCNGKDIFFRSSSIPGPDQLEEVAEFIVIGKDTIDKSQLALLHVEWEDGVAYRRGLVRLKISDWVELGNRVWKLIILG